jgi:hypothetical protein
MKNDYFETGCIKASCFDANAQPTLFQVPAIDAPTCNSCEHRERWGYVRSSNLTENGLLKIRCKDVACSLYEPCKPIDEPLCK